MKKLILISLLAGILALFQAPMVSAVSIDFNPTSPQGVTSGGTLNVDVVVSGLTGGQIVSAYDLDVLYNKSFLAPAATAVTFGLLLGDPLSLQDVKLSSGLVDFAEVSLLPDADLQALQPGTFTLATLNFNVISDGTADYAFSWTAGNDVKGLNAEVIYSGGGKVPEPATMLLIGSGLLGLVGLRRKFKK